MIISKKKYDEYQKSINNRFDDVFNQISNIETRLEDAKLSNCEVNSSIAVKIDEMRIINEKSINQLKNELKSIKNDIDSLIKSIVPVDNYHDFNSIDKSVFYDNEVYFEGIRIYTYDKIKNFYINSSGECCNNKIYLNKTLGNGKVFINLLGKNNIFKIGMNNIVKNDVIFEFWSCFPNIVPENVSIMIGDNNNFNGEKIKFICPIENGKKIIIGNDNLFGGYITFRGRNDHLIYDINTKKRVNEDENIIIGNQNWVCDSVTFLPKTYILDKTIIGEKSLINRKINEKNVLIAGIPGVVKKKNVMWNKNLDYSLNN